MIEGGRSGAPSPGDVAAAGGNEVRPGIYYLAGLDVWQKPVLVVGSGPVAVRKVKGLRSAGARVTMVAPGAEDVPEDVVAWRRPFREGDLDGMCLAVAATDDPAVNARVARAAAARGIWVNVVDDPQQGTMVVPATFRRGRLSIAISTGGASPALASKLREQLEPQFGSEHARLVDLLWRLRVEWEDRAIDAGLSQSKRAAAWRAVVDAPLLDLLRAGRDEQAEALARSLLEQCLRSGR